MTRELTAAGRAAIFAQETAVPILELLTVYRDNVAVFRVANNTENVSSRSNTFTACGFDAVLPEEKEDGFSALEVTVNNVDQWATQSLREAEGELELLYEVVSPSDLTADPPEFDNVEQTLLRMQINTASITETAVKLSCSFRKYLEQTFPFGTFNSRDFPGAF